MKKAFLRRKIFLSLVGGLFVFQIHAQKFGPSEAEKFLKNKNFSLFKRSDSIIGMITWENGDSIFRMPRIKKLFKEMEAAGQRERDHEAIGHVRIGWIYLNRYRLSPTDQYRQAMKVLDFADSVNSDKVRMEACELLAGIFSRNNVGGKAVSYHFKALKYAKKIGDYKVEQSCYYQLGYHYYTVGKNDSAILNLQKAVDLIPVCKNPVDGSYEIQSLLARTHSRKGEYATALKSYYKLKPLFTPKPSLTANAYMYMADLHNQLGNTDSLMWYARKSLELDPADPGKKMIYINALYKARNYRMSEKLVDEMLVHLKDYPRYYEEGILEDAVKIYPQVNRKDDALEAYARLTTLRDSIYNSAGMNEMVQQDMSHDFEKELDLIALEQKKKDLKVQNEKERQKLITIGLLSGLILVVVFFVILFSRFRLIQKQKKIIDEQKAQVEIQKEILEEKNKEIVDSINYAKRIQYALLAHDELLKEHLPEHFVFFQPKDIVSGDFYWATRKIQGSTFNVHGDEPKHFKPETLNVEQTNQSFYLAVCDSTGHGVPGAFMSLLNTSFLNEAINEKHIDATGKIFDEVRRKLVENISQEGAQDGMDGILVKFHAAVPGSNLTTQIEYTAANNAPLLIGSKGVAELPFDKMPVGKSQHEHGFTTHTFEYVRGDMLYLLTDGFADQFGGEKGKKYKFKNLTAYLQQIAHLSMQEQKQYLHEELQRWKGDLEQVDDVCVVGIRL